MSTKLPSSTPMERAFGPHLVILKCVNTSFYIILGAYGIQVRFSTVLVDGWRGEMNFEIAVAFRFEADTGSTGRTG